MALTRLTCDSIGTLDEGRAAGIINAALAQLYRDIEERGHDEKARSLAITLTFETHKGLVVVDVQAKVSTPPYRTNLTSTKMLTANSEPVLCFQQHDAENPEQATFPSMDSKAEGEI
jgi:hypothetical protein